MNREAINTAQLKTVKANQFSDPDLIATPIFILGIMQRSGTNFLQDLLCLHPDCVPGEVIYEDFVAAHADLLVQYANSVYGNYPSQWEIEKIMGPPDGLLCQYLGNALISFLNLQLARQKRPSESHNSYPLQGAFPHRLVTKTPSVKNLHYFFKIFPQAHLLIIVRDGRAVIESGVKSFDWSYDAAMHAWADAARTILQFDQDVRNANHRYLVVRYKDILTNTKAELIKILSFLGLDVENYDFDAVNRLPIKGSSDTRNQIKKQVHWTPMDKTQEFDPMKRWGHWRRAQHERFNWIAGEYLVRLGYTKQTYPENQKMWDLWNVVLDIKWKVTSRLKRFSQVLNCLR